MRRVTGFGGIFFKARDPVALRTWYGEQLGIDVQEWGGAAFRWADPEGNPTTGTTIWSVADAGGDGFAPSASSFMVNYRVSDLHALLHELRKEGCNVLDRTGESDYVRFGPVIAPEGNKVELREPPAGQCAVAARISARRGPSQLGRQDRATRDIDPRETTR